MCVKSSEYKEAVQVKLIKIGGIDSIQFVPFLLCECTEDSSSERLHKLQIQLILQTQGRQDPIFLSLDST